MMATLPREHYQTEPDDDAFTAKIKVLRTEFINQGLFRPSALYYSRKTLEVVVLACVGIWWRQALLLGLAMQQAGWLSHDIVHRQVLRDAPVARKIAAALVGSFGAGMTPVWWCRKHSLHHALPNVRGVDEDIATDRPRPDWKYVYAWPLFLLTTLSCAHFAEAALVVAHYFVMHAVVGWKCAVLADLVAGALLAAVIVQSHGGKAYPDSSEKIPFYIAQVRATRNASPDALTTWFTGGLNYQIEHHLFPTLPRHSFGHVAGRVRAACRKHRMAYESPSL